MINVSFNPTNVNSNYVAFRANQNKEVTKPIISDVADAFYVDDESSYESKQQTFAEKFKSGVNKIKNAYTMAKYHEKTLEDGTVQKFHPNNKKNLVQEILPDGTIKNYIWGQIYEKKRPDGTVTKYNRDKTKVRKITPNGISKLYLDSHLVSEFDAKTNQYTKYLFPYKGETKTEILKPMNVKDIKDNVSKNPKLANNLLSAITSGIKLMNVRPHGDQVLYDGYLYKGEYVDMKDGNRPSSLNEDLPLLLEWEKSDNPKENLSNWWQCLNRF